MTNPVYSPPLDLITTAVLDLLRTGGRTVYDHAYAGNPTSPAYPYDILYALTGGSSNTLPDLDDRNDTVTLPYQVTTVSNLRNQCQFSGRVARDRLLARTPSGAWVHPLAMPAGWACIDRRPDPAMPGVDRTGDTPNALFSQPQRFYLTVTPS